MGERLKAKIAGPYETIIGPGTKIKVQTINPGGTGWPRKVVGPGRSYLVRGNVRQSGHGRSFFGRIAGFFGLGGEENAGRHVEVPMKGQKIDIRRTGE